MPEVSICIPTYNYAHFLPDAVGSILRQRLRDFEIVIVDNASEDNTEAVVRSFNHPCIRYLRNPFNIGAAENGNRSVAEAKGEYVKLLCADDVLLDGVLEKQVNVLRSQPEVKLVTCNLLETDQQLRVQKSVAYYPGSCPGQRVIRACLSSLQNYIGGPSNFMFRRVDSAGIKSDVSYRWVADLKWAFQILGQTGVYVNIDQPGYLYRRHGDADSVLNCPPHLRIAEFLRLVDEFDGWNLLGCVQAVRLGRAEGRRAVFKNVVRASSISRSWRAFLSASDVLRMRRQARMNLNMPFPS